MLLDLHSARLRFRVSSIWSHWKLRTTPVNG